MRKKKSTQQLVGIESVTDSSVLTAGGELTFYLVQPTNLNVLPESGVRTRVTALLNVLKTSAEMELLALDAKESYQDNRLYYVACCGTAFTPVEQMLRTYPQIRQVYLCLDNDEAGHNASERMEGYLHAEGISTMRLVSVRKDWNEDLVAQEEST